ncbi:hypothetical protein [Kitasatospora sp. NPDC085879]|uniref:hypothetical protein n=1 Tax=Kitasatospora sp. NPDC085879 TaxID=3154769 RepID=UPI000BB11BD5|nr:hypothetical protein [Streptomyces sp. TLI_235]
MNDTTPPGGTQPTALLDQAPPGPWSFLNVPPPLTGRVLLAALREAERAAHGELRELWGFAAMNAEAAMNALPGTRPAAGELWAAAQEYAQIAASVR